MRKWITFILLIVTTSVTAQFSEKWKVVTNDGVDQTIVSSFASTNEARGIIDEIISVMGLKVNFEVREANVPNAAAVFYNKKRYILYNPVFIKQINRATKNDWASISILAHEIGHHVKGHTFSSKGNSHQNELEADAFSGLVLRKMGASLEDAQAAMQLIAGNRASATHPGKSDRLDAIAKGWGIVTEQVRGDVAVQRTDPPVRQSRSRESAEVVTQRQESISRESVLDDKYILVSVNFSADKKNEYYVTTRHNVVRWNGHSMALVGKVVPTSHKEYPYYIYDADKNYVHISKDGYLVNQKGKKVGYLSMHTANTANR